MQENAFLRTAKITPRRWPSELTRGYYSLITEYGQEKINRLDSYVVGRSITALTRKVEIVRSEETLENVRSEITVLRLPLKANPQSFK